MSELRRQFEWVVMRHLDAAYNVARWYLRNDQDAEDVVQDSMVGAYQAFGQFKGSDGKPWLLKIVRNRCLRHLERNKRMSTELLNEDRISVSVADDPAANALRRADSERVRAAIESLPDVYREVIVLREFEELSYAEVAAVIDVPAGTVMSRLARARAALAQKLREEPEE